MQHEIERASQDRLVAKWAMDLGELLSVLERGGPEAVRERVASYAQYLVRDVVDVVSILQSEGEIGEVKWFDPNKGYGFIKTQDSRDIFVHWRGIAGSGYRNLEAGQRVRFKRRLGVETWEAIDVTPETP